MTEREEFEAWWNSKPWPPGASAWNAWQAGYEAGMQAARAAPAQPEERVLMVKCRGDVLSRRWYWTQALTNDVEDIRSKTDEDLAWATIEKIVP
jgi:hypothetical protein